MKRGPKKSEQYHSCHFCQNKKEELEFSAICSNKTCKRVFCEDCIINQYDQRQNYNPKFWVCYKCQDKCECSKCKQVNLKPSRQTRSRGGQVYVPYQQILDILPQSKPRSKRIIKEDSNISISNNSQQLSSNNTIKNNSNSSITDMQQQNNNNIITSPTLEIIEAETSQQLNNFTTSKENQNNNNKELLLKDDEDTQHIFNHDPESQSMQISDQQQTKDFVTIQDQLQQQLQQSSSFQQQKQIGLSEAEVLKNELLINAKRKASPVQQQTHFRKEDKYLRRKRFVFQSK